MKNGFCLFTRNQIGIYLLSIIRSLWCCNQEWWHGLLSNGASSGGILLMWNQWIVEKLKYCTRDYNYSKIESSQWIDRKQPMNWLNYFNYCMGYFYNNGFFFIIIISFLLSIEMSSFCKKKKRERKRGKNTWKKENMLQMIIWSLTNLITSENQTDLIAKFWTPELTANWRFHLKFLDIFLRSFIAITNLNSPLWVKLPYAEFRE